MKRLLIVPAVLSLIIFSLYHEDVDGMDTSTKGNVAQEILMAEEILEVYNNSKVELNSSIEINETIEEGFSVIIKGELNTTKETMITLVAKVENAQNLERCNFFWYEGKDQIGLGSTLKESFDKGEHNITLIVKDADGNETQSNVTLTAYDYHSIRKLNYDAHYGNLLYTERSILNHKGQHILNDDGIYSKTMMTYDNDEHLIERVTEYYNYPKENKKMLFTYDQNGNRVVSQTFNSEGVSVFFMLNVYDDNSTLIDIKFGTNEEDIEKDEEIYSEVYYDESSYDSTIYEELKVPEDIVRLNDNGKMVYEEHYYGDIKVVNKMTYNEENKLVQSFSSTNSYYSSRSTKMEYDAKGNPISTERKYEAKGRSSCHYNSDSTYTDSGQIKSQVSTLLGGVCPYIDEIKRVYSYDSEGSVTNVKSSTDGEDMSNAYTTLEVINEYTNELDIY